MTVYGLIDLLQQFAGSDRVCGRLHLTNELTGGTITIEIDLEQCPAEQGAGGADTSPAAADGA